MLQHQFFKPSRNPLNAIESIAYPGQSPAMRMYKEGYEKYFEMLPVLKTDDIWLKEKIHSSKLLLETLAQDLIKDPFIHSLPPLKNEFNRTILSIEDPEFYLTDENAYAKEGAEIILARWGDGFTSPVHGHAPGLLYEKLLYGQMRVNTYQIIDHSRRIVRPLKTELHKDFTTIASQYNSPSKHERSALVHNFTSIGNSATMHFIPEHTRDGRDNGYTVEYFEDYFKYFYSTDTTQLNARQGIEQLRIGDVALVRSENVPEYGDHFIVITGKPVLKEHGLRPQDVAIHAPNASAILDNYSPIMGLTLLKLNDEARNAFIKFHGIGVFDNKVIFPEV